ncbi:hypothetical protein C2845_PM03G25360 [Panicum miliaceum]|uniref:Uncharacterized protein n=1 Tax=Panicum miliaceum TaxID=4540 RepID=A0A3L6TA94_PANMI|nr:hypothetical protein C2845_PM03G25360 [Panicum miliaceum]
MEMETSGPNAKRRKSEVTHPRSITHRQEAPPPDARDEGEGVDRISSLPDAILGDIISLLSMKEGARTQILASRWPHTWRAAPLILDGTELTPKGLRTDENVLTADDKALASTVSLILSTHPGPGRRFCIPAHHLFERATIVDTWLRSPALDNLQELDFWDDGIYGYLRQFAPAPPPASAFRFSGTLRVATFGKCQLPDSLLKGIHFSHLKQLALEYVSISEESLHTMISSCPILECLLVNHSFGFSCIRISSSSLRSIGVGNNRYGNQPQLREFIIVDAPCLERLLFLRPYMSINVSVIAAPKLETLGCPTDGIGGFDPFRIVFGTTTIQELQVINMTTVVRSVKIIAVKSWHINLDMVIDLMKCFPCLEKLYIKCCISGDMNRWRRKQRQFIKCFDIHLKTIVLQQYRGTRSQVNFASFFLLNARKLDLMKLEVDNRIANEAFFAEQSRMLQMEKRASRTAQLHFTTVRCLRDAHVNHVRDLAIEDPFECRC